MIFDDLLKSLQEGRSPILLTERTAHVEYFENRLKGFAKNVIILRGGMGKKQREALREQIKSIPDHEERVFIATGKLIGEGFDDSRLDTLFLCYNSRRSLQPSIKGKYVIRPKKWCSTQRIFHSIDPKGL
jgi:superfamily II DNA or RNA helicase